MKVESYTQEAKNNYRNEIKRLDEANRHLVQAKEKQLENLEKSYDKRADTVRTIGEERLISLRDELAQKQQSEMANNEQLLEKSKEQLLGTQKQLEVQRRELSLAQRNQLDNQQVSFTDTINTRQSELADQTKEINDRTNEQVHKIIKDSDYLISDQNFKAKSRYDQAVQQNDVKARQLARDNELKLKDETLRQYQESANAKLQHDRTLGQQNLKNASEFNMRQQNFQKQLETQDTFYSQKIRDQHEAFKQKLSGLTAEQEKLIQSVTENFQKEIEQMVSTNAAKKRELASKQSDSFYHVSTIDPKLTETEKSYMISLPLPEHERDGARLTAHDRVVRLNFTRHFEDQFTDESGGVYKSKRSEVIGKEFNVDSIVDSKLIKQVYADGVLTFILPKK